MGVLYYNDRTIISTGSNSNNSENVDVGSKINILRKVSYHLPFVCYDSYFVKEDEGRKSTPFNSNVLVKLQYPSYVKDMLSWLRTKYTNFMLTFSIVQVRAGQHAALEESIWGLQTPK
jgi:hypothetical protein